MPTNFAQVGRDLSSAIDFYTQEKEKNRKKKLLEGFVERQMSRLPPEQAAMAAGGGMAGSIPAAMGQAPAPEPPMDPMAGAVPPWAASAEAAMAPEEDVTALLGGGAPAPLAAERNPEIDALRMLLEGTQAEVMEPQGLFDYVAGMGKQDQVQAGRRELKEIERDVTMAKISAAMEQILARLQGQKEIEGIRGGSREAVAKTTAGAKVTAAETGRQGKVAAAEISARGRGAGKPADPAALSDQELEAELRVHANKADSLNVAGMSPDDVGYKPAEEQQFRIDETARQKDLSKAGDRVTQLEAEKAKRAARGGKGAAAPAGGGKVYNSKAEVRADIQKGLITKGQSVIMMLNGQKVSTVPVK